jgi:hypothetical protein
MIKIKIKMITLEQEVTMAIITVHLRKTLVTPINPKSSRTSNTRAQMLQDIERNLILHHSSARQPRTCLPQYQLGAVAYSIDSVKVSFVPTWSTQTLILLEARECY